MRVSFIFVLLFLFSYLNASIFFIEYDYTFQKLSFVKLENEVKKYEIPVDIFLGYNFLNDDEVIFNVFIGGKQKLLILNLVDNNQKTLLDVSDKYIQSIALFDENIIMAVCPSEELRLTQSELYYYSLSNRVYKKVKIGNRLNFDHLDCTKDGNEISFLHTGEMKDSSNFCQKLIIMESSKKFTTVDSVCRSNHDYFLPGGNSKFTQWISNEEVLYKKYDNVKYPNGRLFKYNTFQKKITEIDIKLPIQFIDFYFYNGEYYFITENNEIIRHSGIKDEILFSPGATRDISIDYITVK